MRILKNWLRTLVLISPLFQVSLVFPMENQQTVSELSAASSAPEEFVGQVLTEEGEPADGAQITAAAVFRSPPLRIVTKADNKGHFRLKLPPVSGSTRYMLAIRWKEQGIDFWNAPDATGKSVSVQGQQLPPHTVRLRQQGTFLGRLLQAEDDRPVVGADVFLDTGEVLTTNELGEFTISGFPLKDHSLIPVARGRARQYILFDTSNRPQAELELRLPRGATVRGRVIDEAGNPVAGAYLHRASSGTALTLNGWDQSCDKDGRFEYFGLTAERLFYNLEANAPGYHSSPIRLQVKSGDDEIENLITLKKKANSGSTPRKSEENASSETSGASLPRKTITGQIRDSDGKAIEGATIRWGLYSFDESVKDAMTNADGEYTLVNVPDRDGGALLVMASGYAYQFVPLNPHSSSANAILSRGQKVQGVIKGSSGTPVAGAKIVPVVRCIETGFCNPIWLTDLEATSDDNGQFEINGVPPLGTLFDILKPGYSDERNTALTIGDSINTVHLDSGGAATGLVIDSNGKPVRNFKVRVMIPRNLEPNENAGGYYGGFDWYGVRFTDKDGRFILTDLNAGSSLRLIVSSPDHGLAIINRVRSFSLEQIDQIEVPKLQLKPFQPLQIRVISAETGKPIESASVGLLEDEQRGTGHFNWGHDDLWLTRTRSNVLGDCLFPEPECEDGTIIVTASGYARQRMNWNGETREVSLFMQKGSDVTGTILFKDQPLAEGYVRLSSGEEYVSYSLDESPGEFQFESLTPGEYSLEVVDSNGQQIYEKKISLITGEQKLEPIKVTVQKSPRKLGQSAFESIIRDFLSSPITNDN